MAADATQVGAPRPDPAPWGVIVGRAGSAAQRMAAGPREKAAERNKPVRNIYRSGFMAGLLLLSGLISLLVVAPVGAATAPPVQIIQVVESKVASEESFQLYNNSAKPITLD